MFIKEALLSEGQDFINQKMEENRMLILFESIFLPFIELSMLHFQNVNKQRFQIVGSDSVWEKTQYIFQLSFNGSDDQKVIIDSYNWTWDFGIEGKYVLEHDESTDTLEIKHLGVTPLEKAIVCFLNTINFKEKI